VKAIVYNAYGGPDVLHLAEVDTPTAGAGQIRVRVMAVGVNALEVKIRSGMMQGMIPVTFPAIPGSEIAGVVDQVGAGVAGFSVGDAVLGWSDTGAYAEYVLASTVVRKPEALAWAAAAALPIAVSTVEDVLAVLGLRAGETLLVHGAAGGVGSIAVQLAVQRGATVIGTASAANQDYLRALGAIPLLYGEGLVQQVRAVAPQGIDAVFDVAGKGALPASIELRGGTSRIATIADPAARSLGVAFVAGSPARRSPAGLARVADAARLAAMGDLTVTIDATFPLEQAAEAQRAVESGHARGKVVLRVDQSA
jgi:NADPH:quinone reductase-like Zn-dependent oxidoreductase